MTANTHLVDQIHRIVLYMVWIVFVNDRFAPWGCSRSLAFNVVRSSWHVCWLDLTFVNHWHRSRTFQTDTLNEFFSQLCRCLTTCPFSNSGNFLSNRLSLFQRTRETILKKKNLCSPFFSSKPTLINFLCVHCHILFLAGKVKSEEFVEKVRNYRTSGKKM